MSKGFDSSDKSSSLSVKRNANARPWVKRALKVKKPNLSKYQVHESHPEDEESPEYQEALKEAKELTSKPPNEKPEDKGHFEAKGQIKSNVIIQTDLIEMPLDGQYHLILVAVDVGSRKIYAKAIQNKESSTVRDATLEIFKEMGTPPLEIQSDAGSEFKGEYAKEMKERDIFIRYAQANRHSQQSIVETSNQLIVRRLFQYFAADEIKTKTKSVKWVSRLDKVIKYINEKRDKNMKSKPPIDPTKPPESGGSKFNKTLLKDGTKVRVLLDAPEDFVTGKKTDSKFREGDRRWGPVDEIERAVIIAGEPIRYMVKSKKFVTYSRAQIKVLDNIRPSKLDD